MPNPLDGCLGLKAVFGDHIYKDTPNPWALTAAISGAHTLGSARISTSGFDGFWSDSDQQGKFNNDYYRSLLVKGWAPEFDVNGVPGKNQWRRVDVGASSSHKEMMLDTDMCLAYLSNKELADCKRQTRDCSTCEAKFGDGRGDLLLADQGNCCAWTGDKELFTNGVFVEG